MYEIVDETGHLWATAETLQAAAMAAQILAEEEQRPMHITIPKDKPLKTGDEFSDWLMDNNPISELAFELISSMYPTREAMYN